MGNEKKSAAAKYLEKLRGGPLTFGALLRFVRESDEHTLEGLAKRFGVSRAHLCEGIGQMNARSPRAPASRAAATA